MRRREEKRQESRQERRQAGGLLQLGASGATTKWRFSSWRTVSNPAFGGYDVVASRRIAKNEIIVDEVPMLVAAAPDCDTTGWAMQILEEFCALPAAVREQLLATNAVGQHEAAAEEAHAEMCAGAHSEVALCAKLPWRLAHPEILDSTLARVCLIARLNVYSYGASHVALFAFGCQMNHACDANVRFSSTERDGRGCFIARRDVAVGESLCTNYIGEMTDVMSTPARRDALLASKLFTCQCAKCRTAADPLRHVPCPGCHPREGVECSLPASIAAGRGEVHYAHPLSAEPGAQWLCDHCSEGRGTWTAEDVLVGPRSPGGLTGRPWEVVLERNVLHFDAKAQPLFALGLGAALVEQAEGLHEAVSRSVGSRHWTTRRLAEILEGARAHAAIGSSY